jgi:hypothetical protein
LTKLSLILTIFIALTACNNSDSVTSDNGQTFQKDWTEFTTTNWSTNFLNDNSSEYYLNKKTQGRLVFKNKNDTTLTLTYYVYFKSEMDSAFNKKIIDWLSIRSCVTMTNDKSNFISFYFGQNYYLLKPCHRCHTATNKDCELLSGQLLTFIMGK